MNLIRTAAAVSGLTLLSRITGLIRELLTASAFGAGPATDAFFVAFRLPNLLRRLFAEGAFSQAFVPVLGHYRKQEGEDAARQLIDRVGTALFWVLAMVTILGVIGAPVLVWVIAGGFSGSPETQQLAVDMTRWMFPYVLLIALVSMASGILNTWGEFRIPAFTPVLLNLAFIGAALIVAPWLTEPIWALVGAVVAGGIMQLGLQAWALRRRGLLPRVGFGLRDAFSDPGVRRTLKLMVPSALAMSVAQISLIINTNLASHQAPGSVSWLSFADRLMEFPTAMLGIALGTVLMPSLTRAHASNNLDEYSGLLDWGLRLVALLALPASVALALFAEPLVAVMYHYGKFTGTDVTQTAQALMAYAVGLVGLIGVKVLAPGFYAQQDTKTPMWIGIAVLVSTQLLNFVTVPAFAHAGLALSISLAACVNALMLLLGLLRRGLYQPRPGWLLFFFKLIAANAFMAAALLWMASQVNWIGMGGAQWPLRIAFLAVVIIVAVAIYFGVLFTLGLRPKQFLRRSMDAS